tara:strand:+ start:732 stop:1964 length:1233 start_codon:yes stop_codon:yes gene_type:complete
MEMTKKSIVKRVFLFTRKIVSLPRVAVILIILFSPIAVLGACSWLPEELDVTTYLDDLDFTGYLWGEDDESYSDADTTEVFTDSDSSDSDLFDSDDDAWLADEDEDFPVLSAKDTVSRRTFDPEELAEVERGLVASRDSSRYTEEVLRSRYLEGDTNQWDRDSQSQQNILNESVTNTDLDNLSSQQIQDSRPIIITKNIDSQKSLVSSDRLMEPSRVSSLDAIRVTNNLGEEISNFRSEFNARFSESGGLGTGATLDEQKISFNDAVIKAQEISPSIQNEADGSKGQIDGARVAFLAATINFGTGASGLSGKDHRTLKEVGNLYQNFGGKVKVIGHASSRTRNLEVEDRKIANLNISVDRANAVAEVLMRHGVPADQLEIIAMSDKEPIAHEYMPSGERENQRTEIYIEY